MNIPLIKSLAFRVTMISLLAFCIVIIVVLSAQYWFARDKNLKEFTENSNLHFASLQKSKILDNEAFLDKKYSENVFTPFDESGNSLGEVIIFQKSTSEFLINEIQYLSDEQKNILKNFPENTLNILYQNGIPTYFYTKNYGDYKIFYTSQFPTMWEYYYVFFDASKLIFLVIIFIFSAISLYFSRLVVRPIREQNASLSAYNKHLAHELKTPLSIIRSNLEMLELTDDKKFIASSREEISHLEEIVDSLLFLTRKKISEKNFETISLYNAIEEISEKFPKLTIENEIPEDFSLFVQKNLFSTFLKNILENAKKYSTDSYIRAYTEGSAIIFENNISENMNEKELAKITEIFYQGDLSRASEGYGIGIPVMIKIAELFDWGLEFESYNKKFFIKIFPEGE